MIKKSVNIVGMKFGRLTVIEPAGRSKAGRLWKCRCDCGKEKITATAYLTSGGVSSCGCALPRPKDMTGQRFGKLTVIRENGRTQTDEALWLCKCDCGNEITIRGSSLRKKNGTRSCGCLKNERPENRTHGKSNTRLYVIYGMMKSRCYNSNSTSYKNYGGRGIRICDEWLNDFECFYEWAMANGYDDGLEIDRIDNDGNYTPENCKWSTKKKQANNRRSNHLIELDGETHTLAEWCKIYDMKYSMVIIRINRLGWDAKKALTTPSRRKRTE